MSFLTRCALAAIVAALVSIAILDAAEPASATPQFILKADADFLALHVGGNAPKGATALAYRLSLTGTIADDAEWTPVASGPGDDGAFGFDVPLPQSRWGEIQVRALKGAEVLAAKTAKAKPRAFTLLTDERLASLAAPDREAWMTYIRRSNERFEREFDALAAECRQLGLARATPAPSKGSEFEIDSATEAAWLASVEANRLADVLISFQTPSGGWSKAVNYTNGARAPGMHWTSQAGGNGWHYCGTLDNRTTTEQIELLAGVCSATGRDDAKAAALRGIEWLLEAQFPNGGWPQNYPVEPGYHEAITLNDNATLHALELLLEMSEGTPPFAFTEAPLRERTRAAFEKGIACLAAAQVNVDGQPTVWCAQHHPITLAPVAARKLEPPSLSGAESAELVRFLMRRGPTTPALAAMIEPALKWFDARRITGLRKTKTAGKTDYVPDASATEVYWARFYDIETGQPIFPGAQDGVIYSTFSEMAARNKVGYDYFTTKPRDLLEKETAKWRKRLAKSR
jgi:PelA/Pel-15E family pectate lyase